MDARGPGRSGDDRLAGLPSHPPARGWRTLSLCGRRIVVALAVAGSAAIAIAWPQVQRDRRAGEAERAAAAAESSAPHSLRAPTEERAPPACRAAPRPSALGSAPAKASNPGWRQAWSQPGSSLRSRATCAPCIAAGKLEGPLLATSCDPVRRCLPGGVDVHCLAFSHGTPSAGRVMDTGLPLERARRARRLGTLAWCKENLMSAAPVTVSCSPYPSRATAC